MTVTTGEIDGIPAVWRETPTDELTGSLVFGVGWHSQSVLTRGIDEVLLGCVVGQVAYDVAVEWETGVLGEVSVVSVRGMPTLVAWSLTRLCDAFVRPDFTAKRMVARSLAEDEIDPAGYVERLMLHHRFGALGPGSSAYGPMASSALTDAELQDRARASYHRGNVYLVLDGPPPPGLRLPLPAGPAQDRSLPPLLPVPSGSWRPHDAEGAYALSLLTDGPSPAVETGMRIARTRCASAMHGHSDAEIECHLESMGGDRLQQFSLIATGADGVEPTPAHLMIWALDDLARRGPTDAELEARVVATAAYATDVDGKAATAEDRVRARLLGAPSDAANFAADVERLTSDDVARAVRALVSRAALVLVPDYVELPGPVPGPPTVTGSEHFRPSGRSPWSRRPGGRRLTVGPAGVSLAEGPQAAVVLFNDVVGLLNGPDGRHLLIGLTGNVLLETSQWRHGRRAADLVMAAVPDHLQRDVAWV